MPSRTVLALDLGTTLLKACVYQIDSALSLKAARTRTLTLRTAAGMAEQDPDEWWAQLCSVIPEVLDAAGTAAHEVQAVSFCAQMQCLVLTDAYGRAVRPAISYLDQRATERRQALTKGGPRVAGIGAGLLLPWLHVAGGVAASAKDPLWKYLRVRDEEPRLWPQVHRWLDAKDALIARMTGRFTMSTDSAFATFLCDTRATVRWSPWLVKRFGVEPDHLPEIVPSSQIVGTLTAQASQELGLPRETVVLAGGGDASLIPVGAGAVAEGQTHVYSGTSGWVSTATRRRRVDASVMMATVPGAQPGLFAYFGEQETSGKCLEWVRDHLALDEIGVYLQATPRPAGPEHESKSLIDYLTTTIAAVEPGSGGVLFAPWLHGSRSPFEDPWVRGLFFNVGLETGKRHLIRAVVEGLAFNKRWLLEAQERRVTTSRVLRFAGGGALSDQTCQILADVTGRVVEAIEEPQNAGAAGAALLAAWALGQTSTLEEAASWSRVRARFEPSSEHRSVYERNYAAFRDLYRLTKPLFRRLNAPA